MGTTFTEQWQQARDDATEPRYAKEMDPATGDLYYRRFPSRVLYGLSLDGIFDAYAKLKEMLRDGKIARAEFAGFMSLRDRKILIRG